MRLLRILTGLSVLDTALAIPYEEYILAPRSRTLHPVAVHSSNGTVTNAQSLTSPTSNATFSGEAATALDLGVNIAGIVTLSIAATSSLDEYIGVTFSESSMWISNSLSDSTTGNDQVLWFHLTGAGNYTAPREKERGAFRYMTLVHNGTGSVQVGGIEVHYTAMPHWKDDELGAYTGYFHCDDDLLNRIWYAGAYTNQICTIDPKYGNSILDILGGNEGAWYSNYTISNGSSVLVDGAKRDRLVWGGDMAIAVPAIVVSTNDVISIENGLNQIFDDQETSGQLPYGGRPLQHILSFTYQLYNLIGVANHHLYTGNTAYLSTLWPKFKLALSFSLSFIDSTDLMNVTSPADWLRFDMAGHNIEANSILYHTLYLAIDLATALKDTAPIPSWRNTAEKIKIAANALLWREDVNMYADNETSQLFPQDGNAWAVVSNITQTPAQTSSISQKLRSRWTPYGAPAPEAADAVSPFISGFEIQAHFLARNVSAAVALMRLQWGFMLDDPRMTNSTFVEGYSVTGKIHYAPYSDDKRISHAHGWSTGPTAALMMYVAGIQVLSKGGETWRIVPALGDLKVVEAGFESGKGMFRSKVERDGNGGLVMEIEAPGGTSGEVWVPNERMCKGRVVVRDVEGKKGDVVVEAREGEDRVVVGGLVGGKWRVEFGCAT